MPSPQYKDCLNAIKGELPDAEAFIDRIEAKMRERQRVRQESAQQALEAIKKEEVDWADFQKVVAKRNALDRRMKADRNRDFIRQFESRAEGVMAISDTSTRPGIKGAKDGVYDESTAMADAFLGEVNDGLIKADVLDAVVSGRMDDALADELQTLHWNKKHPDRLRDVQDPTAHKAAVALQDVVDRANDMLRHEGVEITIRDDFAFKRWWNVDRLRALGRSWRVGTTRGLEEAYAKWRAVMDPILDTKKTFDDAGVPLADREDWLKDRFTALYTGEHSFGSRLTSTEPGTARIRKGRLADRITAQRRIHLVSPEAEVIVAKEFGAGTVYDSIIKTLRRDALDLALLRRFGTGDPMTAWKALVRGELADLDLKKPSDIAKQMDALRATRVENTMHSLLGDFDTPTDHVHFHRVFQSLRTLATLAKMGTSTVTAVTADPVTFRLTGRRLGVPALEIEKALAGIIWQSKDGRAVGHALGFALDSLNGATLSRLMARGADVESFQGKLLHKYFSLIGMNQWNERSKTAFLRLVSGYVGQYVDDAFDALPELLRKGLWEYGIGADEWGALRKATSSYAEWGSVTIIDPTVIRLLPDAELDSILKARGTKATSYSRGRLRTELEVKYRTMLHKESNRAILTPGNRETRMGVFNSKKGTAPRMMGDIFMQFKIFPLTYWEEIGKMLIHESGAKNLAQFMASGKFLHIKYFGLMAELILAGYLRNTITDFAKGFAPRRMWTKDGTFLEDVHMKTFFDAFMRSGGLGFYPEMLVQEMERTRYAGRAIGPALELPFDMAKLALNAFRDVADPDADVDQLEFALKTFRRHAPGMNIFWLDPIMRYMIFNAFTEALAPGSLRKSARRREERNFQTQFAEDRQFSEDFLQ